MNQQTQTTSKTQRPRICKGILVTSTNQARLTCMKHFVTVYLFRPISYNVVKRVMIDLPLINT